MEKNDSILVQEHLSGDKEAIKTLVARYLKPIYNFVYRLSGNADEAHDITQETFVKIWKNLKKFDQNKKFSTWAFSIARNTTIDWLRKNRPTLFSDFNVDEDTDDFEQNIPDNELLPHELFERKEIESLAEKALLSIPLEYRTIVILHNNNELTFDEISFIMKKPMNTMKSQYRRALILMKKYLEGNPAP